MFIHNNDIYTVHLKDNSSNRLTEDFGVSSGAVWSPDGSKIAFSSNVDGDSEIYVMNADGSDRQQLTHNTISDQKPAWSPNGTEIAYISGEMESPRLWLVGLDGKNPRLVIDQNVLFADWSPDGKTFVVQASDDEALVSQNSKFKVYQSSDRNELSTMNSDGAAVQALGIPAERPVFSPDGRTIAYTNNGGIINLYKLDTKSRVPHRIGEILRGLNLRWSPDGAYVLYTSSDNSMHRYRCNALDITTGQIYDLLPDWRPTECDWTR